jgi:PEGA domain
MTEQHESGESGQRLICCLLAMEIDDYQGRPVFEQIPLTQAFKRLLADTVEAADAADLIRSEQEDSAVLCFVGEPTQCFASALKLRKAAQEQDAYRDLNLRIAINLGPVRVRKNSFGHPELSGEGMRDAQLALRDAQPGEIVVARAFFEVLSRTAPGYASQLKHKGLHENNDPIALDLYQLGTAARRPAKPADGSADRSTAAPTVEPASRDGQEMGKGLASPLHNALASRRRARAFSYGIAALVAIAAGAGVMETLRHEQTASPSKLAQSQQKSAAPATVMLPAVEKTEAPASTSANLAEHVFRPAVAKGPGVQPLSEPQAASPSPDTSAPGETGVDAPAQAIAEASAEPEPAAPAAQVKTPVRKFAREKKVKRSHTAAAKKRAIVTLAVKPWGEIYVDGKKQGVSPPLKTLKLEPGRRSIVVKNGAFRSYRRTVEVSPNAKLTVAHVFN